jgi:hypothetical protein
MFILIFYPSRIADPGVKKNVRFLYREIGAIKRQVRKNKNITRVKRQYNRILCRKATCEYMSSHMVKIRPDRLFVIANPVSKIGTKKQFFDTVFPTF